MRGRGELGHGRYNRYYYSGQVRRTWESATHLKKCIVQVKLAGKRAMDDGSERDIDSAWAWITLYERQGDKWIRLLEVSNSR